MAETSPSMRSISSPSLIPSSRWRDGAFWASVVGPLVGVGFLAYFAQRIAVATIA